MSDEEEEYIPESDYLPVILGMVNGFCKLNYEVPQTSSFCTSNCLLPINAKVNSSMLNNISDKSQKVKTPDTISSMLKNVNISSNESKENLSDKQLNSSNLTSYEYKTYIKPSYSENSNNSGKKEESKRSLSPKSKKKKNKFNKIGSTSSALDNQALVPSTLEQTGQNAASGYINHFENERLEERFRNNQEQELQKRQMKSVKNNINDHMSRSRTSISEIGIPINDDLSSKSQCPLCFKFFPTPNIEAHASECSI